MIRATKVLPARSWNAKEADRIELPHDGRHSRRVAMRGQNDTVFLLDLTEAAMLRDGDGLLLEDGRIVRVVAASEPIAEITGEPQLLARVAWQLGNHHVPVEILPDRIRIGHDHGLEEMAAKLGAQVARIEAPFDPEAGTCAHETAPAHGHRHDHPHEHPHGHDHDHGHDRANGHDRR
ncbi:MAG: urease accessory protein UreE [Xanthobacteraceae bacterium]|nr:urease accessory protein UreE [Xanthobacteraceae bacterium]